MIETFILFEEWLLDERLPLQDRKIHILSAFPWVGNPWLLLVKPYRLLKSKDPKE
jgi:hypothetical protein